MIRNQNADPARTQPRDLRPASLAARQRVTFILPHMTQPELFDQLFQPVMALGASHRQCLEYRQNVLLDSEFAKDRSFLGEIADSQTRAFVEGHLCNTLFTEPNSTFVRLFQPDYHVKR